MPDPSGGVYIAGSTTSDDFPATEGAFDTIFSGSSDAFVAKLDSNLTALPAATLLGGSSGEDGRALALDTSGDVYVAGETSSRNYPTTKEAFAASLQGTNDIFVSRLDSLLSRDSTPPESCIYRLVVQKGAISGSGGTGEISVTASSDRCSWTAESAEDWITLTEGAEGTGDGTVSFSIEANPDPTPRRGTLTVAGRTVTVTQKAAIPHLSAPSLVSFGTVTVGESAAKEVTVRNTGTGVLEISRVSVLGKGFELEENTCETGAVAPDSACTVTLRFSPSSTGSFRGRLSLESNDPDHPITGVLLTGKGKQSSE
ncbi:MAG: choice-of-anchor D domain-containing protein [Thermodesulfovibrionales bacterium]